MPLAPSYMDGMSHRITSPHQTINYLVGRTIPKRWKHINCCSSCGTRITTLKPVMVMDIESKCLFMLCDGCANE